MATKTTTIPQKKSETVTTPVFIESKYLDKNIKISPRKLRLIANTTKKISPAVALDKLLFTNTKSARILHKAIKTAIATAKNNYSLDPATLSFVTIEVNEGLKIKKMDKSHGSRFNRGIITRRHSRLKIILKGQPASGGKK